MPRANRKSILLWTTLLTSLGAGALCASARPGWVQDRIFGSSDAPLAVEPPTPEQVDAQDRMIYAVVVKDFDDPTGELLEMRCGRGARFAEIQDFLNVFSDPPLPPRPRPLLEVEQDHVRAFSRDLGRFEKPYALSPEESRGLWNVITAIRPQPPSRLVNNALLPLDPFRGYGVELAVCEDGWLWTGVTHSERLDNPSPIEKALQQYAWRALPQSSPEH